MTEIPAARLPLTRSVLAADLGRLGVPPGGTLLVHSSLSALGPVLGGATTVVHALLDVLGAAGTLVVPAQTTDNRDPSSWLHPPPPACLPAIRDSMPAFDPASTPSSGVGVVPERVRTWPGAVRSDHPQTSFAAVGARAAELLAGHRLDSPLGEGSPLARLEAAGGTILLLGTGFDRCTAFHLAEYRLPAPPVRDHSCVVLTPAGRRWVTYSSVALDAGDFAALGADFEARTGLVGAGAVGRARCRLFPLPAAVAFAAGWFRAHRPARHLR